MTTISIHFGALAPDLKEQLKDFEIDEDALEHFQKDADAITRLSIRSLIPDSVARTARQKLVNNISKKVS